MDNRTPGTAGARGGHEAAPLAAPLAAQLAALTDPSLDPLFWQAERIGEASAWWQHVPFAHWLVRQAAPRSLVELGARDGISYSAFCHAVQRGGLPTRCWAVQREEGDQGATPCGGAERGNFRSFHDARFLAFSGLLRMAADAALPRFADRSIDLLHIDGLRTQEAARHDFEAWLPKMSERGVVLLHGTNVLEEEDAGVWRLWAELRGRYPAFEFLHGGGLGVLCVGEAPPPAVLALTALADPAETARLRGRFAWLGERWEAETRERLATEARHEAERQAAALESRRAQAVQRAEAARAELEAERDRAEQRTEAARSASMTAAFSHVEAAQAELEAARRKAEQDAAAREQLLSRLLRAEGELHATQASLRLLTQSTLWRAAAPLRSAAGRLPPGMRRGVRGAMKLAWWSATLQLPRKLRERREIIAALAAMPQPAPAASAQALAFTAPTASQGAALADLSGMGALRVVCISGEASTPGHLYRVERPAAAARRAGAQVWVVRMEDIEASLAEIGMAQVLWMWRVPLNEAVALAISTARRNGARVVFDVDDLLIDPRLARSDKIDGIRSQKLPEEMVANHFHQARQAMLASDLCTTSTEELAWHMRDAGMPVRVLPNGFDHDTLAVSRRAARHWAKERDGLLRIGYASGSRTHQKDFKQCAAAVAGALRRFPEARLVLFRFAQNIPTMEGTPTLDVEEFPELAGLEDRIEWRPMVPLPRLPEEVARFDVNLAPLEVGNDFCEAKSELKYFEAALVDVPTIASPTGPYRRAMKHGETGYLAGTPEEWSSALEALLGDAALRRRMAAAAQRDVLWAYGPEQRNAAVADVLEMLRGGRSAALAFRRSCEPLPLPVAPAVPEHEVVYEHDALGAAAVTVIVPLYNYARHVAEALDSVVAQTLRPLDLVIVDDASTDDSRAVALRWAAANAGRFNRLVVARNLKNAGLGLTRNVAFTLAETPWVLPLDADNRLLPDCAAACLRTADASGAAFAYPIIRKFGDGEGVMNLPPYDPVRMANGNYIDAMALISRAAWNWVGGYDHIPGGWEDFDFWCRLMERGLHGEQVPGEPLAEYRVHHTSMINTANSSTARVEAMIAELTRRHPWLTIIWPLKVPRPKA
ncbi:glycosyltransferase [Teichococcus aestuarii]|uniref:glycosyltransferase n=1 Tax=Teichococcus aestuarii TaxID=568898 RepID=UPI00361CE9C1